MKGLLWSQSTINGRDYSGGTQTSSTRLQLHFDSSKEFAFYGQIISPLSVLKLKDTKTNQQKDKTIRLQIHLKSSEPTTLVSQLIPNRCPLIVKGTGRSF